MGPDDRSPGEGADQREGTELRGAGFDSSSNWTNKLQPVGGKVRTEQEQQDMLDKQRQQFATDIAKRQAEAAAKGKSTGPTPPEQKPMSRIGRIAADRRAEEARSSR